jgi:hypothetical protein
LRENAGQIDSIEREPNFDKVTRLPYGMRAHPTENDAIEAVNRIGLAELGTAVGQPGETKGREFIRRLDFEAVPAQRDRAKMRFIAGGR